MKGHYIVIEIPRIKIRDTPPQNAEIDFKLLEDTPGMGDEYILLYYKRIKLFSVVD